MTYLEITSSGAGGLSKETVLNPLSKMPLLLDAGGPTGELERRGEWVWGGVPWPLGELLSGVWEKGDPTETCFFAPEFMNSLHKVEGATLIIEQPFTFTTT